MSTRQLDGALIARSSHLGAEAHRVLWYLTTGLEFGHFSPVAIGEISRNLGLKSQAVSRALRTLVESGIIERGPRVGQRSSFRFTWTVSGHWAP